MHPPGMPIVLYHTPIGGLGMFSSGVCRESISLFPLSDYEMFRWFFTMRSDCVLSGHFIVEPRAVVSSWIIGDGLIHFLLTVFPLYRVVSVVGCWGVILATIGPRTTQGLSSRRFRVVVYASTL